MENAKTLILNNKNDNKFKAILNLKTTEPSFIKFFNINSLNKNFALGIKQKEDILKIPLDIKNNICSFNLPKNFKFENNFFCAVVDVTNIFCPEIILSGSINELSHNVMIENAFIQNKPEKVEELYEEEKEEQIEKIIDKNLEDDLNTTYYDSCSKCKYRQAFYDDVESCSCICNTDKKIKENKNNISLLNDNDINELKNDAENKALKQPLEEEFIKDDKEYKNEDVLSFYHQIKPQIDSLFVKYKNEELLESIISNSKWIKVEYENNEEFYVLGLVYNDDLTMVEYISYGIPSQDNLNPPEELKEYAQWLPIDFDNQKYKGYWIVYQEAKNGETIKVNMV